MKPEMYYWLGCNLLEVNMSAYNFMIDAIQSGELSAQAKTIEDLNKKCDLLYEWVQYLNSEIERLKNGECKARESKQESPVVETP